MSTMNDESDIEKLRIKSQIAKNVYKRMNGKFKGEKIQSKRFARSSEC